MCLEAKGHSKKAYSVLVSSVTSRGSGVRLGLSSGKGGRVSGTAVVLGISGSLSLLTTLSRGRGPRSGLGGRLSGSLSRFLNRSFSGSLSGLLGSSLGSRRSLSGRGLRRGLSNGGGSGVRTALRASANRLRGRIKSTSLGGRLHLGAVVLPDLKLESTVHAILKQTVPGRVIAVVPIALRLEDGVACTMKPV
jgi:hypothetical protein